MCCLLPCVRGEKIDCFALTEPGAGSDANAIKTRAVRDAPAFDQCLVFGRRAANWRRR